MTTEGQSKRVYLIEPMGKPRQTQSDKWKVRSEVARYRAFKDECRLRKVVLPPAGARVTFVLPMPASWPKKKRLAMDQQPHQQKPDVDNLGKALLDAVFPDDSHVWDVSLRKIWGNVGMIIIE